MRIFTLPPLPNSVRDYLTFLDQKHRSPLTIKAAKQDLTRFMIWWERQHQRHFEPALLLERDVLDWRAYYQKQVGAAPATINRALASLRGYYSWATRMALLTENIMLEVHCLPQAHRVDCPTRPLMRCCAVHGLSQMRFSACGTKRCWRC